MTEPPPLVRESLRSVLAWLWLAAALAISYRALDGWHRLDSCYAIGCDFGTYYRQARNLSIRPLVIEPGWLYPPLAAMFFTVLAPLSEMSALGLWVLFNLGLALVLVALSARELRSLLGRLACWPAGFALVCVCLPVIHSIKWGQISLLLAVGSIGALQCRRVGGCLLGFLAGMKLFPLAYLIGAAARRDLRFLLSTSAWALIWGLGLPWALLGGAPTRAFFRTAFAASLRLGETPWELGHTSAWWGGAGLTPSLIRWFRDGSHVGLSPAPRPPLLMSLSSATVTALSATLSLLVLGVTAWRLRRPGTDRAHAAALSLTAVTLLLQPAWHHYFAFLPFAQAVALGRGGNWQRVLALSSWVVSGLCLLLLPDVFSAYFIYSAWGGTTVACILVFCALVASPAAGPAHTHDASPAVSAR